MKSFTYTISSNFVSIANGAGHVMECPGVCRAPLRPGSATNDRERLQQGTTNGHAEP